MPLGVGYGPYAAAPPEEEDPLAAIGLSGMGALPPMPPPPPGGEMGGGVMGGPAPGMPPVPMPGMPQAGGMQPGGMGGMQDPMVAQFLQGKSPEELARLVVEMKFKGGAAGPTPSPSAPRY